MPTHYSFIPIRDQLAALKAQERALEDKQLFQNQTKAYLTTFIQQLQDSLDDSNLRTTKLTGSTGRVQTEIDALRLEERSNTERVREGLVRAEQTEAELGTQEAELKRVQHFILEGNRAISELESKVAHLSTVKHQLSHEAGQQTHQLDSVVATIAGLASKTEDLESSINAMETQLAGSNNKIDTCKQEMQTQRMF